MSELSLVELWNTRAERDTALAAMDRLATQRNAALADVRAQLAANRVIIEERDSAEKERTELLAEATRLTNAGNGLIAQLNAAQADVERLKTENEGLRADLLRMAAERDTDRLDLAQVRYERDGALAECKKRHAANAALWEAQQEHQRKADHDQVIIEALREALERTEKRLTQAKARRIPPALVGLLGAIRREAAAAEKMIL